MATHHPIRKHVPAPEIPDKLYFRIGDVARLCEVPAYVLRFWETEFPQLKPNKGGTGQRLYRKRDVEMALRIKSLLYDQGYTIPGARQVFKNEARARELAAFPGAAVPEPIPDEAHAATPARPSAVLAAANSAATTNIAGKADTNKDRLIDVLREELRALQAMLAAENLRAGNTPADTVAPAAKLKTMRPRLVAMETPARAPEKPARTVPRLELHQPGLFGGFDDEGPVAS